MSEGLPREIRGLMIPVTGGSVLLPNATIAEVVSYAEPDKIAGAPAWLLGRVIWRSWNLPLISFATLIGNAEHENTHHARIAVLKALGGNATMPYLAMLAQGFPQLTTVVPDLLINAGSDTDRAAGVRAQVLVRNDQAYIPDLAVIEHRVAQALAA